MKISSVYYQPMFGKARNIDVLAELPIVGSSWNGCYEVTKCEFVGTISDDQYSKAVYDVHYKFDDGVVSYTDVDTIAVPEEEAK